MSKIILMGNYPPPFGGVSTHIKRLYALLKADDFDVQILDISQTRFDESINFLLRSVFVKIKSPQIRFLAFLVYSFFSRKKRILHIHIPLYSYLFSCNLLYYFSAYKFIFTIHDQVELDRIINLNSFRGRRIRSFLRKKSIRYIAVSNAVVDQLLSIGVSKKQIICVPAFLPDTSLETKDITEITNFMSKGTSFIHYACSDVLWGQDVYGINFVLSSLESIKQIFPDFRLLMLMPFNTKINYQDEIDKLGFSDYVMIHTEPVNSLTQLFKSAFMYLRTTSTDGDAVAVREAMSVGCRVIASDVSKRPNDCLIYAYNDLNSFIVCLQKAHDSTYTQSKSLDSDFYTPIKNLYINNTNK